MNVSSYPYDLLLKWNTASTPAVLQRIAYTYDQAGNRIAEQINDTVMGASYDSKNRITSHQPSGLIRVVGALNEAAVVTIQGKAAAIAADNVFEGTAPIASGTTTIAVTATDSNNNVATNTYEIENAGSAKTFTFDANGNITSDGVRTFNWDGRNQLIAVEVGAHRTEFTYNGARQRVGIRELENSFTISERKLLWCGQDLCEERDASNVVMRRYFYHGMQDNGTAHFFTRDHLGSNREVVDSNEAVEAHYDYEPFGARTTISGALESTVGFGGHYWHSASNLVLAPYRAYDSSSARWTSEDPLGTVDGPNLFAYVANNPVSWRDPTGLVRMVAPKGILPPNGNLWGGFDPQDGVCTWPAVFGNVSLCTFKCCESHDRCYFESRCNFSSWARSLYGSSPCAQCNQTGAAVSFSTQIERATDVHRAWS
jgi:RHS repeat-associated protein